MEQVAKAIGYLVYSVACSDGKVEEAERQAVHSSIDENWKLLADQEDPFGARALDFIDKMMTYLEEKGIDSEFAFEQFIGIYQENREKFTPVLKQFMINVCIHTGSSFNRMNKSELVLLSRIEKILKD